MSNIVYKINNSLYLYIMIFVLVILSLSTLFFNYFIIQNDLLKIVLDIRLPRYIVSLLIGAILGICGCIMQNITHNPLAEPNVLGIASCSSVGSIICLFFGYSAVIGGVIGSMLGLVILSTSLVCKNNSKISNLTTYILLKGLIINSICGAIITLILQISQAEQLPSILFWIMGDLSYTSWNTTLYLSIPLILSLFIFYLKRGKLNYLWVDADKACSLGISSNNLKLLLFVIVAILIGISTSQVGSIGFIGIISPYITQYMYRNFYKNNMAGNLDIINQIYYSAVIGALLVSISDGIAKNIIYPSVISISVITSFIGVPIFWKILYDLHKKSYF